MTAFDESGRSVGDYRKHHLGMTALRPKAAGRPAVYSTAGSDPKRTFGKRQERLCGDSFGYYVVEIIDTERKPPIALNTDDPSNNCIHYV